MNELVSYTERLILVFMPREFQTEGQLFDQRFLFVGPSLIEAPPEPWPLENADSINPRRVYVSLGTLRNDDPEFYRTCFSAFDSPEWQIVMSVGERIDLASLGPIPDNFLVSRFVKQTAILSNTDVFVTHGGLNSTIEGLFFGVPLVVIPGIKEQHLTAARVEELGLGVVLRQEALTAELLAATTRKVALDPEIQVHLKEMQRLTRLTGGFKCATEAIVEFTADSRPAAG
jgi:MGT family glycosyltransferase